MITVFLLGLLSLIQITFLPGFLLLRWLNIPKTSLIQRVILIFGLSFLANYCGIFMLTALNIYKPLTMYLVFITEVIIFIYIERKNLNNSVEFTLDAVIDSLSSFFLGFAARVRNLKIYDHAFGLGYLLLLVLAIIYSIDSIVWLSKVFRYNIGDIFQLGDAVQNWNPWAILWYRNIIPTSYHYPQLIPTSFSLTYTFMNNSQIQFFATAYMPLFALFTLLIFLDLGLEYKQASFFIALVFTRYMMKKFAGYLIDDGYVDIAIMFFFFLPIYSLLKANLSSDTNIKLRYLLLGSILSAAAAVTKQSGVFILILYPLLSYWLVLKGIPTLHERDRIKILIKHLIIAGAIAAPWYVYSEILIWQGKNAVELFGSQLPIYEKTILRRILDAFTIIEKYNLLIMISVISIPLLSKFYRWLVLAIVLPYLLLWSIFLSYDARNLTPVIPILSLCAGVGFEQILFKLEKSIRVIRLSRMKLYGFLVIVAIGLLSLGQLYTDDELNNRQIELQKNLWYPQLNQVIYSQFDKLGPEALILTNYRVDFLPEINNRAVLDELDDFDEFNAFLADYPDIRIILLSQDVNADIVNFVIQSIENGDYTLAADFGWWLLVEINH
ncbi:MAG: hypothetical protein ABIJ39_03210 [Chloroflexota bacterium]